MRISYLPVLLSLLISFLLPNKNEAQNWQAMSKTKSSGGSINYINNIYAHGDTLWVATTDGVWCSASGSGGDWTRFGTGLNSTSVSYAEVSGNYGVALAGGTIYYLNSSKAWTSTGISSIGSVALQETSGYFFASKDYAGVYRSTDHGLTWTLYNTTSDEENLTGPSGPIGIHPSTRIWRVYAFGNMVMANSKNAVHLSYDNGENWLYRWGDMIIDHDWGSNIKGLGFVDYKGQKYLFVGSDGSMWNGMSPNINRSADTGVHYPNYDGSIGSTITGLPYSNSAYFNDFCNYGDKSLFLRTTGNDVYKSNDNGLNWIRFEDGLSAYSQKRLIITSKKLILADYYGVHYIDLTSAPSWASSFPTISNIAGSKADLSVNTNQKGKAFYVILPDTVNKPSASQIVNGLDSLDNPVDIAGSFNVNSINTTVTSTVGGMLANTNYKIHIVLVNGIGNESEVKTLSITTNDPYLTVSYTGSGSTSPVSGNYNDTVTLTATPASGYRFSKWTINSTTITTAETKLFMDRDFDAVASFVQVAPLNISVVGSGNAYPTDTTLQDVGKSVTVRAYPGLGYKVSKWIVNGTTINSSATSRSVGILSGGTTVTIHFTVILTPPPGECDSMIVAEDLQRPDATWESNYQQRVDDLFGDGVMSYSNSRTYTGTDAGKWFWPEKLAKMKYDPSNIAYYISLIKPAIEFHGPGAGSFYYPFTGAGYAMYWAAYKDSILKYDPAQADTMYSTFYNYQEWKYLMRRDQYLDMLYPTGKEFNSENFHWMLRSAGHLFSHEFHNVNAQNNYNLSFRDADSVERSNVNVTGYFDGYVNNLVRSLYSCGRVEWNSNNYWAHTFNPLLALYEGADKCNNPDGASMKKKAKACLDWMVTEAALHYLDGYQVAADARAKGWYLDQTLSSINAYTYAYFTDNDHRSSYPSNYWDSHDGESDVSGFLMNSSYRPPQVAVNIAQRKFNMPVEIQSAKPFYMADFGDFWNEGENPYNDWRGKNNSRSRRFEFETMYLDSNFTMSSIAGGRPDGGQGTFSEQAQWEIGIRGTTNGALQIGGNAANYYAAPAGRCPYHEIAQYRNIMMHLVKLPSSNQFYILIPDASNQIGSSGSGSWWSWNGNDLFLDMGNNVYMALRNYGATGHSVNTGSSLGDNHTQITWSFTNGQLGGIIIEMGKKSLYGSFSNFISQTSAASISSPAVNTVEYLSASGHILTMEYTEPTTFLMSEGTFDTPSPNPLNPAGNYPKVWGDGIYIDYTTWDSYKTVFGEPIIEQQWGSGKMVLQAGGLETTIKIDTITSNVTYSIKDASIPKRQADFVYTEPDQFDDASVTDTSFAISSIQWDFNNDAVWDATGNPAYNSFASSGLQTVSVKVNTDANCFYTTSKTIDVVTDYSVISEERNLIVYPIPAETEINIEKIQGSYGDLIVTIVDESGKTLVSQVFQNEKQVLTIHTRGLKSSTYILTIREGEKLEYSGKIIIK